MSVGIVKETTMEFGEKLAPDAEYILRKADTLMQKIRNKVSLDMVSLEGQEYKELVLKSSQRYREEIDKEWELSLREALELLKENNDKRKNKKKTQLCLLR